MPLHKFMTRHSRQNWFINTASLFYVSIIVLSRIRFGLRFCFMDVLCYKVRGLILASEPLPIFFLVLLFNIQCLVINSLAS